MNLALFDLDETLISNDSSGLWLRWLVDKGLAPAALAEQEQYLMKQYYQGALSMSCYMESTLSPWSGGRRLKWLAGLSVLLSAIFCRASTRKLGKCWLGIVIAVITS